MSTAQAKRVPAGGQLRPWLELVRLPAIFTAPSDVLFGFAILLGLGHQVQWVSAVCAVLASVCIYAAGMTMNDYFDLAIDAEERPSRPLPSGRVTVHGCFVFLILLELSGLGFAYLAGEAVLVATGATILCTIVYNGWAKTGLMGPFAMGLCRYGNALIGLSVCGEYFWALPLEASVPSIGVGLYVASLTLVSKFEVGGEIHRSALRLALSTLIAGAVCVSMPLVILLDHFSWPMLFSLCTFFWILPSVVVAWRSPKDQLTRAVVMRALKGIAIANATLSIVLGQFLVGLMIVVLLVPAKIVGRWFYST